MRAHVTSVGRPENVQQFRKGGMHPFSTYYLSVIGTGSYYHLRRTCPWLTCNLRGDFINPFLPYPAASPQEEDGGETAGFYSISAASLAKRRELKTPVRERRVE